MEEIMVFFGEKAEIVAEPRLTGQITEKSSQVSRLHEMVKRRPLRPEDIAHALSISLDDVEDIVKGLLIKGQIRKQEHSGKIYYLSNETVR
jgi:predicted transcriptional regulator